MRAAFSALYERPAPKRGADGYFHPSSEDELCELVRAARRLGKQVRVRGSAHSLKQAIQTDGAEHYDVLLDRYIGVRFDDELGQVTVQAGCHLGRDPRDPTRTSTWENSLLAQLTARGWALPDLGGVSHQTVAGFLSTGSCGGSVMHAIEDAVVGYRLVDGTGRVHSFSRGDEHFDAIGCSLGLLGILSSVTFQCIPSYDIIGRETICEEQSTPYQLYGDGEAGLEGFLRRTEYARLMWWPQRGVQRVSTWQARRMAPRDYAPHTGSPGALKAKPYLALGDAVTQPHAASALNQAAQAVGGLLYDGLAQATRLYSPLAARGTLAKKAGQLVRNAFAERVLPPILRAFVPTDGPPQHFWDSWHDGLPMDNQMSEASLPTQFTEIWVPLEQTGEVMRALREHYDRGGYDATGAYICEVYAARRTSGWMHPSYGRDSLRIDLFWFARNTEDPTSTWFVQFWELLKPFGYRLHWGKFLPKDPALGHQYLRQQLPRWDDFMALRQAMDPDGLFLTRYWREALGLT